MEQVQDKKEEIKQLEEKTAEALEKNKTAKQVKENKKQFTIFGFTLWRLMAYFIVYSILGYIVETIFGLVTKGVLESRKSFLYGPFCAIYGVGAIIVILGLQRFKKNNYTLFFGGILIGSIVEYVISVIGEFIFHIKWWDYSNMPFNINGRICLAFSFFWGILAIYLMSHLQPKIDKLLDKIPTKAFKVISICGIIFMLADFLITSFALQMFFTRLVQDYNLELKDMDKYIIEGTEIYNNPKVKEISDKYFTNEKMLKTFPNIKVTGKDGGIIYICDILKDIQPYYIRVFTPRLGIDNGNILRVNTKE